MKTRFALLLAVTLTASLRAQAGVLPNDAIVNGKTMGEWSAEWWRWAFAAPFSQHPGADLDGSWAHVAQPGGPVFFLAGVFQISGVRQRAFMVPEGKYLFIPLLSNEQDNVNAVPALSVEELRDAAKFSIDLITELHASIDRVPVPNLFSHRAASPVFSVNFVSEDNLMSFFLGIPFTGLVDPIVVDGYYLMVEPLPVGTHVINFGGTVGPPVNFSRDITDTITVVPAPLEQKVAELLAQVEAASIPKHKQALLTILRAAQTSFAQGKLNSGVKHLDAFQRKVRKEVTKLDETTATEWIQAAQLIIDRTFQPPVTVLPPDTVLDGKTIAEWTVEWWKWVYSVPTNQNPMFDADGSLAANGQPGGSVFFVANMVSPGAVMRRFAVEEGRYLLFPVRYVTLDNVDFPIPLTVEELRDTAAQVVAAMTDLHASVNGQAIDVAPHRVMSPVFNFDFATSDNLDSFVYAHPVTGLIEPIVSDGYWLMLAPLPAGTYVIQFGGDIGPPFNSSKEITAVITIVPVNLQQKVEQLLARVEAADISAKRKRVLEKTLLKASGAFEKGKLRSGIHHLRAFQHHVRAWVSRLAPDLALDFTSQAQAIMDRARQDLGKKGRKSRGDEDKEEED